MVVQTQLMTVEAFWEQYGGKPFELVHGKVVEVSPAGGQASEIAITIATEFRIYLKSNRLGRVTGADGGYYVTPYDLRAPDCAYYSNDKADLVIHPEKYLPFPPDLAVEVVSPNDGALEVLEKVELYLNAGVSLVWVVYPELRRVVVHYPDKSTRLFTEGDILDTGELLPGFTLAVATIFETMN